MSGKDAGKTGKVLRVDIDDRRVFVERLNILKKHTKPNPKKNPQGGVIEQEATIDVSNVMVRVPVMRAAHQGRLQAAGRGSKVRTCRKASCGKDIDKA